MVRRKLIIPLVALATMALMLSATGASAEPHTTTGTPHTACVVTGSVALTPGLDSMPSNNTYEFRDTQLECESLTAQGKGGIYDVTATGDTASFWHKDPGDDTKKAGQLNGEDCDQGGSKKVDSDGDGVLDEVHSGELSGDTAGTANDMAGKVHFTRLGTTVLADGPLYKGDTQLPDPQPATPDNWFQAELEFVPTEGDCANTPVTEASLTGTGEIYDGSAIHDCRNDSTKVDDKDC